MKHPATVTLGDVTISSFDTLHDSLSSCGFVISYQGQRFGYATDIGHVSTHIHNGLMGCESVVLEANHDPEMLWGGIYPYDLKERIASRWGHLSNPDCAEFAAELTANGTRNILLAHLSQENNDPRLAYNEVWMTIADPTVNLCTAAPDAVTVLVDGAPKTEQEELSC